MTEIKKCKPNKHEIDNYPDGASCAPCYMSALDCYDDLLGAYQELEARCENDEKSIYYLHEELEALKQWQREAVRFLEYALKDLSKYIHLAPNRVIDVQQLSNLIKQAEEK